MKIYNSLTNKLEEFVPIKKKEVKIYVCGPTVYDYIHIGNGRPIIIFDCFRRYLEKKGYVVKYLQNFTDVDDKIINKAIEKKLNALEISNKYIKEYEKDAEKLNVKKPTLAPKVTENIDVIIRLISKIIEKKAAYVVDGNVYFDVESFKEYGKLSKMPIEELKKGVDVNLSEIKKNDLDFVLWKAAKEGEISWKSPWGEGRPGWHIECSAMAINFLGEEIDIHCGGKDLIFPHHENEIAQSEIATGKKFSNYWMHNGYIKIDGKKMSKSSGNFFTIRELGEKFGYDVVRFFVVQAHYRMPINFSHESLIQAKNALQRIYNFQSKIDFMLKNVKFDGVEKFLDETIKNYEKRFYDALDEDFNTAVAVSVLFEFIRWANRLLKENEDISSNSLKAINDLFLDFIDNLGILEKTNCYTIPEEILNIYEKREKARKEKDYKLADSLRNELEKMGYCVEETRNGSRIFPKC